MWSALALGQVRKTSFYQAEVAKKPWRNEFTPTALNPRAQGRRAAAHPGMQAQHGISNPNWVPQSDPTEVEPRWGTSNDVFRTPGCAGATLGFGVIPRWGMPKRESRRQLGRGRSTALTPCNETTQLTRQLKKFFLPTMGRHEVLLQTVGPRWRLASEANVPQTMKPTRLNVGNHLDATKDCR